MLGAPGSDRLPPRERQRFIEQFERDLKFIQLFYLLLNKSCPIKNVDLVWTEKGPSGRAGLRRMGIDQALESACPKLLRSGGESPHPDFCNIINGNGRHEAESCGVSDKAAEERIRRTGKTQVYRCSFGLVDIAVPVVVDGEHIATLFTGQVLREAPSKEGFDEILRDTAHLHYIDRAGLERAYWSVAVVTEEDIRGTTELLEAFAEYLANSWTRLAGAVKEQMRRQRDSELAAKEFAYLAVDGAADPAAVKDLMGRLHLTTVPNRVLVVKPDPREEGGDDAGLFDLGWTAAIQAVEELTGTMANVAAAYLRHRGVCVFFDDREGHNPGAGDFHSHRLAKRIIEAVAARGGVRVRAGIGGAKQDFHGLAESYEEACLALAGSSETIAAFRPSGATLGELTALSDRLCQALAGGDFEEWRRLAAALPIEAARQLQDNLAAHRVFFSSVLSSVAFTAEKCGGDAAGIASHRAAGETGMERASGAAGVHEAFLHAGNALAREVRAIYAGKRKRLVDRACRLIQRHIEGGPYAGPITITALARTLGISVSHLSRTFRKEMGETFERYTMRKRVELAQRLLLDPVQNVAEVAARCGFSDPSYFARVFRKIAGRSPREYAAGPLGSRPGV